MRSHIYLLMALGLYAVGALQVVLQALTRKRLLTRGTVAATVAGFAVHTAGISQRWTEAGHFPASGLHDGASLLAWMIVLAYLMTFVRTGLDALGLLAYPAAFGLVLMACLTPVEVGAGDPLLKSVFFPVHVTLAFIGYASLFVAFAMGVLYLVQERELKSRSPRAFYYLIPSLERCDTISGSSVMVGFAFLTLAIVTGLLWSHHARGRYWSWDAKEFTALMAWAIYVGLLVTRWRTGWGGRRAALMGIAGFAAVALLFVWTTVLSGAPGAAR
jgi:cytochrome c-type biogenesis protein CcsB